MGAEEYDVLVAYDDTDSSKRAAEFAAERAAETGDSVHVVHIGDEVTVPAMREAVESAFDSATVPVTFDVVSSGGSDDENVSIAARLSSLIADNEYQMVVMGNEEHGLFHSLAEASVSKALIEEQTVPITLVP